MNDTRYAIGDLAELADVSRRTVRYYVQEGLLPAPFGVGRGNHYGREHLDRLLKVKALQEAGRTLDEIRRLVGGRGRDATRPTAAQPEASAPERQVYRRFTLAPGVELHVAGNIRMPPPGKLSELAIWCRAHFVAPLSREEDPHA